MKNILTAILLLVIAASGDLPAADKFALPANPITLNRIVQPWCPFTVVGRHSFFVGKENGISEAWVVPLKILHDLDFVIKLKDNDYSLELAPLARHIRVRPEATTIRFAHSAFSIDATYFAPLERDGLVILLDVRSSEDMQLTVRFRSDLQLMWPGGLGGQFTYWDNGEQAFVISESRRKYAALIGSPYADSGSRTPAHAQPDAPIRFSIPIQADSVRGQFIPIVIAGSIESLQNARNEYRYILSHLKELYFQNVTHYQKLRNEFLSVKLPNDSLNLSLEWAKVALDKGLMDNPQLGRGLVAGFGPSGKGARPGFAWFFGGDAFINSWAINSYGDFETVRQTLEFFIKYQRQDGKIAHEISQSAATIPWFDEYPYAYYHAETTPLFLIAVDDYLLHSGDQPFVTHWWPAIRKAYTYCRSADHNNDGLMDNLKAGLGAVELGKLRKAQTEVDIYLATTYLRALQGVVRLAKVAEDKEVAKDAKKLLQKARASFQQKFWLPDKKQFCFALLTDHSTLNDLTTWQALPLCFGLANGRQAEATLQLLDQPDMKTEWGIHFLSRSSSKYEYNGYNTGAVWPFTTMFTIWGAYNFNHEAFARNLWKNVAGLTFSQQLGTISELFSGDRFHPIEAAVPHQLFSTTPVIVGFVRGLLGYEPDVLSHRLRLTPKWPRHWQTGTIRNLPFATEKLTLSASLSKQNVTWSLEHTYKTPLQVTFRFPLKEGESCDQVLLNEKPIPFSSHESENRQIVETSFSIAKGTTTITLVGNFSLVHKKDYLLKTIGMEK